MWHRLHTRTLQGRVPVQGLLVRTAVITLAVLLFAGDAHAARLAVLAVASPHGDAPIEEADALTSHLIARRHRTIANADARERLLSGNMGAGADWAANVLAEVRRGRAALTRLERYEAEAARREAQSAIERAGGGAAGAVVLVEWALLEAALASSSGDAQRTVQWIERAAALGPSVILDPLVHPELERQAFQDAVERLRRAPPGSLALVSVPRAAELWVDGVSRCRTPCSASVPPGRHFVRVTSPAHAPAVLSVEVAGDQQVTRQIGLTSAYKGASLDAIRAMLDDPSRGSEAQSSLTSVAEFLDVDHLVVLRPRRGSSFSLRIAPAVEGNEAFRGGLSGAVVPAAADAMLRPTPATNAARTARGQDAWYESTALWVGVATAATVALGAGLLLSGRDEPTSPSQGTLVIGGP